MIEKELNKELLKKTAKELVIKGKGILAADESEPTIKKRFDAIGLESTEENRRKYRELLFTTPGIKDYISGVILFEETLKQQDKNGTPFPELLAKRGIIPGVKVDEGKKPFHDSPDEFETQGLESLKERLQGYSESGVKFAKWKAVVNIGDGLPTHAMMSINATYLGRYAIICQEQDVVPIIEPEVLMDGKHDIDRCEEVTLEMLGLVFEELKNYKVELSGILLKPNMVLPGKESDENITSKEIAERTMRVLKKVVPEEVPGIVFLSGGQSPEEATKNLQTINAEYPDAPWNLSFSFGRALQAPVLKSWLGKDENVEESQKIFLEIAKRNGKATQFRYNEE